MLPYLFRLHLCNGTLFISAIIYVMLPLLFQLLFVVVSAI